MTHPTFHGVLPAIVTPVDQDERFVPAVFEKLVAQVYAAGVHGLYVNGQTGEGHLQPVEQRKQVAEAALASSPAGKQVIVHIGAHSTRDTLDLARHASRIGVSAISSLPPIGSYSFAEIKAYYRAISEVAEVPFLVYFFPALAPAITQAEQLYELLELRNVVGLKFTAFDLYTMARLKDRGAVIYNGADEVFTAGLLMGADGGIGSFYNLVPERFCEIYRLGREGRWDEARLVQAQINELIEITLRFPALDGLKMMLGWKGLPCGRPMAPRASMSLEQEARFIDQLANSKYNRQFAPETHLA